MSCCQVNEYYDKERDLLEILRIGKYPSMKHLGSENKFRNTSQILYCEMNTIFCLSNSEIRIDENWIGKTKHLIEKIWMLGSLID